MSLLEKTEPIQDNTVNNEEVKKGDYNSIRSDRNRKGRRNCSYFRKSLF